MRCVLLSEGVITIPNGATPSLEMELQWEEDGGERIVRCALQCLRRSVMALRDLKYNSRAPIHWVGRSHPPSERAQLPSSLCCPLHPFEAVHPSPFWRWRRRCASSRSRPNMSPCTHLDFWNMFPKNPPFFQDCWRSMQFSRMSLP